MNAYWKYNLKYSKRLHLPKIQQPVQDLKQLTSGLLERTNKPKIGRSWKSDELRLKSDSDLHKLWYILLREKLALKSDQYLNSQDIQNSRNGPLIKNCLTKVHVSMSRLRGVVGERNHIRNEFMTFLEFYYIRKKQNDANYHLLAGDKNKLKEEKAGDKKEGKPEEVTVEKRMEKEQKKKRIIRGALPSDETTAEIKSEEQVTDSADKPQTISVLTDNEKLVVEKLKKKYTTNELLKEYVSNSYMLKDKQKRQVKAIIDSQRATQAKKIFMKEMSALSYKAKSLKQSENPDIRKLENLS